MMASLKFPVTVNESECGYFKNRNSRNLCTQYGWFCKSKNPSLTEKSFFEKLLGEGFRRSGEFFYLNRCAGCDQCMPIRIPVEKFIPSKSQKVVWRKNQDLEVRLEKDPAHFISERKVFLFREYDYYHNGKRNSMEKAEELLKNLNYGYSGTWNLEFYSDGNLIGVSVLDYGEDEDGKIVSVSSNYFYYDITKPVLKRSLGVFSVLKELELCRQKGVGYYYLGLYLRDCRKMNYKINYQPYEIKVRGKWFFMPPDVEACIDKNDVIHLPMPGEVYDHPDVCFVTDDMPLQLLYSAYMQGIFPWFNECDGQPVIWQCPEKRFVIDPKNIHISASLKKFLKKNPFTYTVDKCFDLVVEQCSLQNRKNQSGTWIGPKIKKAYGLFHKAGFAHSVEVWLDEKLAGGFYGELIGSVFFGESMFTIESNSSKSAFVLFAKAFEKAGGKMIDCQAYTENMARYGAVEIERNDFLDRLKKLLKDPAISMPKF